MVSLEFSAFSCLCPSVSLIFMLLKLKAGSMSSSSSLGLN